MLLARVALYYWTLCAVCFHTADIAPVYTLDDIAHVNRVTADYKEYVHVHVEERRVEENQERKNREQPLPTTTCTGTRSMREENTRFREDIRGTSHR